MVVRCLLSVVCCRLSGPIPELERKRKIGERILEKPHVCCLLSVVGKAGRAFARLHAQRALAHCPHAKQKKSV